MTVSRDRIQDRSAIQQGLHKSMGGVSDWIAAQSDGAFAQGPAGRWSTGQHLEHLIRSVQPILQGMGMPRFVLRMAYGTVSRPGMDYASVRDAYEGALEAGATASGRYVPPAVPAIRKPALLAQHRDCCARLAARIDRWTEQDLDRYGGKHPSLGMLSLREILFFTIHHHDHHLETLRRDYGG